MHIRNIFEKQQQQQKKIITIILTNYYEMKNQTLNLLKYLQKILF